MKPLIILLLLSLQGRAQEKPKVKPVNKTYVNVMTGRVKQIAVSSFEAGYNAAINDALLMYSRTGQIQFSDFMRKKDSATNDLKNKLKLVQ